MAEEGAETGAQEKARLRRLAKEKKDRLDKLLNEQNTLSAVGEVRPTYLVGLFIPPWTRPPGCAAGHCCAAVLLILHCPSRVCATASCYTAQLSSSRS